MSVITFCTRVQCTIAICPLIQPVNTFIATDDESKSPLEQCSPSSSGIGCDGLQLVGLGVAQESGENGNLPCELVVTAHTPRFPVNAIHKPPRFGHQHVYHQYKCPRLRMLSAPPSTVAAIITASEGATNPFNVMGSSCEGAGPRD